MGTDIVARRESERESSLDTTHDARDDYELNSSLEGEAGVV